MKVDPARRRRRRPLAARAAARCRAASTNCGSFSVDQRLQRRVGPLAADGAGLAAGRVEDVHRRRRRGPLPERVQAAAVQALARVALVVARVAADHRHRFPHAVGLIRLDARPADLAAPAGRWRPGRSRGPSRRPCGTAGRATATGSAGPSPASPAWPRPTCRYVADVTSSLKNCLTSQPDSRNSTASQSSSSGCDGSSPADAEVARRLARGPCRTLPARSG